jgi:hypothetical protein
MDEKLHVYWSNPRIDILDGGLQCIESDSVIVDMIQAARVESVCP